MNRPDCSRFRSTVLLTPLIGGLLLASCAQSFVPSPSSEAESLAPEASSADQGGESLGFEGRQAAADTPRSQPQLVKTADLVITVQSVTDSIDAVKQIAQQQQGDLLGLQDYAPTDDRSHHTASMQIRVPQAKLEAALQALKALGSIQRQSITAEDVSEQLVDYQARLRNLKKTEETLLDIMGRSGEVGDVLKVAQELSNVRNSVEQVTAQLTNLQNRVAYSTISLSLQEALAGNLPQRSTEIQLQETWGSATRSIGKVTVGLLQLGIWLLVYSPYWLALAGIGILLHSRWQGRSTIPPTPPAPRLPSANG